MRRCQTLTAKSRIAEGRHRWLFFVVAAAAVVVAVAVGVVGVVVVVIPYQLVDQGSHFAVNLCINLRTPSNELATENNGETVMIPLFLL